MSERFLYFNRRYIRCIAERRPSQAPPDVKTKYKQIKICKYKVLQYCAKYVYQNVILIESCAVTETHRTDFFTWTTKMIGNDNNNNKRYRIDGGKAMCQR